MKTRAITSISVLGLIGAFACSPSSKNEQKYWEQHQQNLTSQASLNPGFAAILNEHKAKAEVLMKEAGALTDEDAKAEKLKAANAQISTVLKRLVEADSKCNSLESKIEKLNKLKLPKSKHARRNEAAEDASASYREVKRNLAKATPENEADALAIIKEEISTLISAQGALDRVYDAVKPKKEKKSKKKKKK